MPVQGRRPTAKVCHLPRGAGHLCADDRLLPALDFALNRLDDDNDDDLSTGDSGLASEDKAYYVACCWQGLT